MNISCWGQVGGRSQEGSIAIYSRLQVYEVHLRNPVSPKLPGFWSPSHT
ncbi:MAG: hypothetical protein MUE44_28975 [Oscillatoriaceae cyanobacterium Prado104]|nr:hypothetical protein [Oscillatoriaceae cyanobacterium Prado104]